MIGFFTKLKLYANFIYGGIIALVYGYIRYLKYKNRKVKKEVVAVKQKSAAVEKKLEQTKKIHAVVHEADQEAITIEKENIEAKASGKRPTGEFGDPRVRDYQ